MRLLLFADLHLDTPFRWAKPEVASARRRALVETLHAIVDLAGELEVDALCSGGDLFEHELVSPDTPAELKKAFARIDPIPVLLAPGNHDYHGPQSLYVRTEWSPNVRTFDELTLCRHPLTDGFSIWGAAHTQKRGAPGFLDGFTTDSGPDIDVALFHGSLRSGMPYEEEGKEAHASFDIEQIAAAGFAHALVGHFHTPKTTQWHTYPGNPEPLNFGETGERGAVLVEVGVDGAVTTRVYPVARTRVSDIDVDLTGCDTRQAVRDRVEETLGSVQGVVRATLRGEVATEVDVNLSEMEGVGAHLEAVVLRVGDVSWAYDLDRIAEEPTVRGEFVREVRTAGLDSTMERRVLITGLRALEGRKDLAVL